MMESYHYFLLFILLGIGVIVYAFVTSSAKDDEL